MTEEHTAASEARMELNLKKKIKYYVLMAEAGPLVCYITLHRCSLTTIGTVAGMQIHVAQIKERNNVL